MSVRSRCRRPPISRARDDLVWSYPKFEVFRESQTVFSDLTAWFGIAVHGARRRRRAADHGEFVDSHYFPTLGVSPALGRAFLPAEDRVGGPPVAVISDELWHPRSTPIRPCSASRSTSTARRSRSSALRRRGFAGVSGKREFWIPILSAPAAWDAANFTTRGVTTSS